jgi:hypothetical protein
LLGGSDGLTTKGRLSYTGEESGVHSALLLLYLVQSTADALRDGATADSKTVSGRRVLLNRLITQRL